MTSEATTPPQTANLPPGPGAESSTVQRWLAWSRLLLERLPIRYSTLVIVIGVLMLAAQVFEHAQRDPDFGYIQPLVLVRHLALPGLTVYMLIMLRTLKHRAVKSIFDLRPAVLVSDDEYDQLVFNTVKTHPRLEIALLAISAIVAVALFGLLRSPLPINPLPQLGKAYLSAAPIPALLTLASYTLFGWAGLQLVAATIQFGRGLGALANRRLVVNVFDPTNLLPFGSLTLMHSLSVAGVAIGLLFTLGQPEFLIDYTVVFLISLASILALVVPLSGVRRQMLESKHKAVALIHLRLIDCQNEIMALKDHNVDTVRPLSMATDTLLNLRRAVLSQPSWPFRNTLAVLRVILASLAPIAYFMLNELIRAYILPGLVRP